MVFGVAHRHHFAAISHDDGVFGHFAQAAGVVGALGVDIRLEQSAEPTRMVVR